MAGGLPEPPERDRSLSMTPWVLTRPSLFRLPPPLALNSPEHVADLDELLKIGVYSLSGRMPDELELALYWADVAGYERYLSSAALL
jgi:hypothetical protein